MINVALSAVATMVREAVEVDLSRIGPHAFTMEPRGFAPPRVVGLFQWTVITFAQHSFINDHLGKNTPVLFEELLNVFEAGHLPVGWKQKALSGALLVW